MAPSFRYAAAVLIAALSWTQGVAAQSCVTNVVNNTTPAPGTGIQLQQYSYCGGTLNVTVFIENLCYNKVVKVYWTNAQDQSTALSAAGLGYAGDVANSKYEYWFSSTKDVNLDGITRLLNVSYAAVDINKNYAQQLNLKVTPSGPAPTTSTVPAPYASPTGFASDIDTFLAPTASSQAGLAKKFMFKNIQIPGAANGTVIAAQSYTAPNYAYNWVRDSSLTMDVVGTFYANAEGSRKKTYEHILFNYVKARAQEQTDPDLQTGLGEPKFELNNSIFTGPWGRPQNDGPATAALYITNFAKYYLAATGNVSAVKKLIYDSDSNPEAPLKKDLLFVVSNWTSPSFDLWEEVEGNHFYTRMVQRRSLADGKAITSLLGDQDTTNKMTGAYNSISKSLGDFWDPIRNLVLYEYGPVLGSKSSYKDIAVILALIHGYDNDGFYKFSDDRILSSALLISTSFIGVFPLAGTHSDASGLPLGIPVGRYPEDVYNGVDTSLGNPWYLSCASMAQYFYMTASEFQQSGKITVSNVSAPFWNYYAPRQKYIVGTTYPNTTSQFKGMIAALQGWGDAYMRTIKTYGAKGGHLNEEFNRVTGAPEGAGDLTWSYGALLTAAFARAKLRGDANYIPTLSNLAV